VHAALEQDHEERDSAQALKREHRHALERAQTGNASGDSDKQKGGKTRHANPLEPPSSRPRGRVGVAHQAPR
jgi:hypothetical protein